MAKGKTRKKSKQLEHAVTVKLPYSNLNSLHVTQEVIRELKLKPGRIRVQHKPDKAEEIMAWEGNLNPRNTILSGMSGLFSYFKLKVSDSIQLRALNATNLEVVKIIHAKDGAPIGDAGLVSGKLATKYVTVAQRKQLKNIYIPKFEPENLKEWEPEAEVDVFMAFGVLQEYTDFKYCCATSRSLLKKFSYEATDSKAKSGKPAKPDAILIDRRTDEYLIAEFKINSSAFDSNHGKEDIDVLVVWNQDVDDKEILKKLPHHVLVLKSVAREAAFGEEEDN